MLNLIAAIGLNRIGWFLVIFVGVTMISLTFGLQLPHRLDDGQKVLDATDDIFENERVLNFTPGVDDVDGIVTGLGTVVSAGETSIAPEVPQLVAFLADALGLRPEQVVETVSTEFPHVYGLLIAAPVATEGVREVAELVEFLTGALNLTPEQLFAAVQENFPNIATLLAAGVPTPDGGTPFVARWDDATTDQFGQMTRFGPGHEGEAVTTIPGLVDFLDEEVVPRLVENVDNFHHLDRLPPAVKYFPWFFIGVGALLIMLGTPMFLLAGGGKGQ